MGTGLSRAPKGTPAKDWAKEPIIVGVLTVVVTQLPDRTYVASAATPTTSMTGEPANYPNAAMRNLLEYIVEHPLFEGQL